MKGSKTDSLSTSELRGLPHAAEILSYSASSYSAPQEWAAFQQSFEEEMRRILNHTSPDDLNDNMFDAAIDTALQKARNYAAQQHIDHLGLIRRRQGALKDHIAQSIRFRGLLEEDLSEIDRMMAELSAAKAQTIFPRAKGEVK